MNTTPRSLTRRNFLSLSAAALAAPVFFSWNTKGKTPTATLKVTHKKRSIGIKISEDAKGRIIMTARQLNGKKLLACVLGIRKEGSKESSMQKTFTLKKGGKFSVAINRKAVISSDYSDIRFSRLNYNPGDDNQPSSEGFFNWLSNAVNDVLVVVGAAITWLTGGSGDFWFTGGGNIFVNYNGDIEYTAGRFKLEPEMEEDPTVWY